MLETWECERCRKVFTRTSSFYPCPKCGGSSLHWPPYSFWKTVYYSLIKKDGRDWGRR